MLVICRLSLLAAVCALWMVPGYGQGVSDPLPGGKPTPSLFGDRMSWGAFGAVEFNRHNADFRALPGVPSCCPLFTTGDGIAFSTGLSGDFPLTSLLGVQLRVGYFRRDAVLSALRREPVVVGSTLVDGEFEYTIDAGLASLAVEPLLRFRLAGGLHLLAGGHLGYTVGHTYAQRETIREPSAGVFADTRTRERNVYAGALPDPIRFEAAVVGGVGYALPVRRDGSMFLVPELRYSHGLTDVLNNISWRMNAVELGVSLMLMPAPSQAPPVPEHREPLPVKQPELFPAVDISATGKTTAGAVVPAAVRIEEFASTEMVPLLNYVFFDEGADTIPSRYHLLATPAERTSFRPGDLPAETLPVYYRLLDILGQRMQERPDATLILTGCNAHTGVESNNTALSRRRAATVRDYLIAVWNIAPSRLTVEARNLPATPSSPTEADGQAENRRVELTSSDPALFAPVILRDTIRTVEPAVISLHPAISAAGAGIETWTIDLLHGRDTLLHRAGTGTPATTYDWDVVASSSVLSQPVGFSLRVADSEGHSDSEGGRIPVERITVEGKRRQGTADKEIGVYRLILFDYNRAEIGGVNRAIITLIRERTQPGALVRYTGSTDRLGDEVHNSQLSLERAQAAQRALGLPGDVVGTGEEQPPYTNDLPEGRFYSRTVTIYVENPVR